MLIINVPVHPRKENRLFGHKCNNLVPFGGSRSLDESGLSAAPAMERAIELLHPGPQIPLGIAHGIFIAGFLVAGENRRSAAAGLLYRNGRPAHAVSGKTIYLDADVALVPVLLPTRQTGHFPWQ